MPLQSIVAFSASPRKRSNSEILADRILASAKQSGASVEKVRLCELSISPCNACGACLKSVEAPCVIDDDMAPLLEKIRSADGLVFASPIYFLSVNAQMKVFLDRMQALFSDGPPDAIRGKRAAVALTYGNPDPLASGAGVALRMFQEAFAFLSVELTGWVHASCNKPGEIETNTDVLEAAMALGKKLATS